MKDYAGAIVDFTVCIDLNSDNIDAYLYRALTNQKAGHSLAATKDYNSARQLNSVQTLAFITGNMFRKL
jgi:Tfp pilus assembly protein PilF